MPIMPPRWTFLGAALMGLGCPHGALPPSDPSDDASGRDTAALSDTGHAPLIEASITDRESATPTDLGTETLADDASLAADATVATDTAPPSDGPVPHDASHIADTDGSSLAEADDGPAFDAAPDTKPPRDVAPPDSSDHPAVLALSLGSDYTCARMSDCTVRCWGDNRHGQLGDGTLTRREAPIRVH